MNFAVTKKHNHHLSNNHDAITVKVTSSKPKEYKNEHMSVKGNGKLELNSARDTAIRRPVQGPGANGATGESNRNSDKLISRINKEN